MKAIGIEIQPDRKPRNKDSQTKSLCRRNEMTCCSGDEIMNLVFNFQKSANTLRKEMIVLEELTTLFRGDKVDEYFREKRKDDSCRQKQNNMVVDVVENEKTINDFLKVVQ